MDKAADIAARTQRLNQAARTFTLPSPTRRAKLLPFKDGIVELRQKGASLRLIRELLATVDVAVGTDTIARFLAEVIGESISPRAAERTSSRRLAAPRLVRHQPAVASPSPAATSQPSAPGDPLPRTRRNPPRLLIVRAYAALALPIRETCDQAPSSWPIKLTSSSTAKAASARASSPETSYLKDHGIAHCAIDSDHENSTLKRFHPDSDFINLEQRREIDRIFIAAETTNLLVIDCRAASTDVFIDFFDEVGMAEVLRAIEARLTVACRVNHEDSRPRRPPSLFRTGLKSHQRSPTTTRKEARNRVNGALEANEIKSVAPAAARGRSGRPR
jgi:hypothetical protein